MRRQQLVQDPPISSVGLLIEFFNVLGTDDLVVLLGDEEWREDGRFIGNTFFKIERLKPVIYVQTLIVSFV